KVARYGRVAQLAERAPEKREVTGSTPVPATVRFESHVAPGEGACPLRLCGAVLTGFEPAASALTGRRALQTAPQDQCSRRQLCRVRRRRCPQGSSNPRYR